MGDDAPQAESKGRYFVSSDELAEEMTVFGEPDFTYIRPPKPTPPSGLTRAASVACSRAVGQGETSGGRSHSS